MDFLTVIDAKDLQTLKGSGLIGLSPKQPMWHQIDDPMNDGVAGFVAQLQRRTDFQKEFDPIFSIYLSSDNKSPGNILFGGYDLEKYAKKNEKLLWADQSNNKQYWTANNQKVNYGKFKIADYN